MSVNLCVELGNPDNVFYSGQTVAGQVVLKISGSSPISIKAFWIRFLGKGHCYWIDSENETYLLKKIDLNKNDNTVLAPETYFFSFRCELPDTLPSSIEGESGYIRYGARTKMITSDHIEHEIFTKFTVIKQLNLNDHIYLAEPLTKTKYTQVTAMLCFEIDTMEMTVRIPVSGYAPGQRIITKFNADRRILSEMKELWAALVRKITYKARDVFNSTSEEMSVIAKSQSAISPRTFAEVFVISLDVPPTPPTDTKTSSLLDIEYFIKMYGIKIEGPEEYSFVEVPITIGSLPTSESTYSLARSRHSHTPNAPTAPPNPIHSIAPSAPSQDSLSFRSDLPPSYEEAVSTNENNDIFRPKYPVFRKQTSYTKADE